ncbi:MAG: hypothetical protein IJT00_09260, partial [Lachnospiraceae bacterium]|nr:hypothetical protein [Lachnospiraceae bacterium]
PVLTVNGYKEADRNKEIVWPMYVGTTAKQAEKTLDIFSNLFNNLFNKDLKPTASSNSLK